MKKWMACLVLVSLTGCIRIAPEPAPMETDKSATFEAIYRLNLKKSTKVKE